MGRPKQPLTPSQIVIREEVLRRLENGESLLQISKTEGFPTISAIWGWAHEETGPGSFGERYTRAREIGYRLLAEEIVAISDERELTGTFEGEEMKVELTATSVQRNRLRVDTRKWLLSKMLPKVYGDRTTHEVGGIDGAPIKTASVSVVVPADPVAAAQAYLAVMEAPATPLAPRVDGSEGDPSR